MGFQALAVDYNGSSSSGAPYFVIENEDGGQLSNSGIFWMAHEARIWGTIYGVPRASAHMEECYCYDIFT